MTVDKFSISLPRDLVESLEAIAAQDGVPRSTVVREAAALYVASRTASSAEQRRQQRAADALARFDRVATAWGEDSRPGVDYVREVRGIESDIVLPGDDGLAVPSDE